MTPTHREGMAAAKRCRDANVDGALCDARDAITMATYQLSLELRRIPERERMAAALGVCRQITANTRESLE